LLIPVEQLKDQYKDTPFLFFMIHWPVDAKKNLNHRVLLYEAIYFILQHLTISIYCGMDVC